MKPIIVQMICCALLATACGQSNDSQPVSDNQPVGEGGWLQGNTNEKFEVVARQLRGFDMAMVETGHRFNELYFAGEDQNWGSAKYHAEKIGTAIRNGLERRPKRAASAETFLNIVLPEMLKAIEARNVTLFRQRYQSMLSACNTCHRDEKVEFISVVTPTQRLSPTGPALVQ